MAKSKPEYEVNSEFNDMALKLVDKYPDKFTGVAIDKICCVNVTNKDASDKPGDRGWTLKAVKMPEALHNPYGWYVILIAKDWDEKSEKHKVAYISEILHGIPDELDNQGKVRTFDCKGYHAIFNTLGLDYLGDPDIPHLLNDEVEWKE